MNEVKVIGIDLAKSVFAVCVQAEDGGVVARQRLKRAAFERYMSRAPRVLVGLEAGPGAHYWARWLAEQDFAVKVMSPRAVRAYRSGPHKSDALDAAAVAEAAGRAGVRAVPVKSEAAQTLQALIRVRERRVGARTRVLNQLRGLLLEFGIALSGNLFRRYPATVETPAFQALPERARQLFAELFAEARALDRAIERLDRALARALAADPLAKRLTGVPGIGPINASQLIAQIVAPDDFASARAMPAYLGLVPRLIASGKSRRLGPITKHGPTALRKGLVLAGHVIATAALRCPGKDDPLYLFARRHPGTQSLARTKRVMAFEQTSVKPSRHRPPSRRNDRDSRTKAQPIMAPRNIPRDPEAGYMTVRHHRKTKSLQTGKGPYMTERAMTRAILEPGTRLAAGPRRW